jgi:hypothetical protein
MLDRILKFSGKKYCLAVRDPDVIAAKLCANCKLCIKPCGYLLIVHFMLLEDGCPMLQQILNARCIKILLVKLSLNLTVPGWGGRTEIIQFVSRRLGL